MYYDICYLERSPISTRTVKREHVYKMFFLSPRFNCAFCRYENCVITIAVITKIVVRSVFAGRPNDFFTNVSREIVREKCRDFNDFHHGLYLIAYKETPPPPLIIFTTNDETCIDFRSFLGNQ